MYILCFLFNINESSLKSLITPKSSRQRRTSSQGDIFNLLIFSSSSLELVRLWREVRGKNGKNQQVEGFLDRTHKFYLQLAFFSLFL